LPYNRGLPESRTICPTITPKSKGGNNDDGDSQDDEPSPQGGGVNLRLLAYLFWVALSLIFVGVGLLGYPIVTIVYGFLLAFVGGFGLWSQKHNRKYRLFTLAFIKEIYDSNCNDHSATNTNKQSACTCNFGKEDSKYQANNNCCNSQKEYYEHHTPPRGKS
jgi:hypothetical protein